MQHEYTERNARALFKLMRERVDAVDRLVNGPELEQGGRRPATLARMLEHGKFPATESAGLVRAFDAFCDALDDLEMAMCIPFDIARQDAEQAVAKARQLGVDM